MAPLVCLVRLLGGVTDRLPLGPRARPGARVATPPAGTARTVAGAHPASARPGTLATFLEDLLMSPPCFVGIDVPKAHLAVHLRPQGEAFRLANDAAGIAALVARLAPLGPACLVLEATGGLEIPVAAALGAAGLAPS